MNFTPELSHFQGALLSADNIQSFSELSAKGGNEEKITLVIENISKFLDNGGYTNEKNTLAMRKFAFYIVLNADLPVLSEMLELNGIDSAIWTVTTIPQCLMCELMWNLNMDQYIQEIISYTYPQLAVQVSDAFLNNFNYLNPHECLDKLKVLSTACYNTITRLHVLNSNADSIKRMSRKAFTNFQKCIRYFKCPPNLLKLKVLTRNGLCKYYGKRLHAMLLLISTCTKCFVNKLEKIFPGFDVYLLTYEDGTLKTEIPNVDVCNIEDNVLKECLSECHTEMLDICKALIMDVSVDIFCSWSEMEENGKTMQQTIGELCYKVRSHLLTIATLSEHPVLAMLEQIARKPEGMEDIINATEDDIILQKVDDQNGNRNIWIQSLIHKEKLCHNLHFLQVISDNLKVFDQEQCHKLYTMLDEYVKLKLENQDYAESLMIKVFHQCSLSNKYRILDKHFNNNNLVDMKQMPDFEDSMTKTFNKFIATPDSDLSDVLTLFLQNPQEVYTKIFMLATENTLQADVMLKVMKMFEKYSNFYYNSEMEPCIIKITQDTIHNQLDTTAKENNAVKFISGLKDAGIIPGSKLLLLIIMTNMHQALITKDVKSINFHIKLLSEAYRLEELHPYRAPMLAMTGKILDILRWRINTFTVNAVVALNATIEFQNMLFNTYHDGIIPEKESDWLKSKLGNLHPLNMYYYRALWHTPSANYLDAVSGSASTMSKDALSLWMSQVIGACTQQEWCYIWDSQDVEESVKLETFHDALGTMTLAERHNRTDNSFACLLYCYRNFVYIIRYKYFKEPLTDGQVCNAINHIAAIVELIKEDFLDEFTTYIIPLFAYLSEKQTDHNINYSDFLDQKMKDSTLTSVVKKRLNNGTV